MLHLPLIVFVLAQLQLKNLDLRAERLSVADFVELTQKISAAR